jgi:catechol 2,3-dioxygenase-like lactoylglutathione lyase family enzyme
MRVLRQNELKKRMDTASCTLFITLEHSSGQTMTQSITALSLLVADYDEAITFFTQALRFELLEDTPLSAEKRWVRVAPPGGRGAALLLARAVTAEQRAAIGNQTGGRVFLFLHTEDFACDYAHMQAHGVRFTESPRSEAYGRVVVFLDLYGNKWDLVELKQP